jgi:hypothetical protein
MKKKAPQLKKLSLQKTAITALSAKAHALIAGGSGQGCEVRSLPDGALSCIGNTCESWYTEDPSCRNCSEI